MSDTRLITFESERSDLLFQSRNVWIASTSLVTFTQEHFDLMLKTSDIRIRSTRSNGFLKNGTIMIGKARD